MWKCFRAETVSENIFQGGCMLLRTGVYFHKRYTCSLFSSPLLLPGWSWIFARDEISTTLLFNIANPKPSTRDTRNGRETCAGAHAVLLQRTPPSIRVLQGQLELSLCSLSTIAFQKGGGKKDQNKKRRGKE